MIKPNELRLGNWVIQCGKMVKCNLDTLTSCSVWSDFNEFFSLKPIFLTDEILLKCGFELHPNIDYWEESSIETQKKLEMRRDMCI